ncbi:hypothetical protein [Streptomyces albus]|uniref:hypothetical protein n=1 Tax=Streptomyces albus TaxID=1888 RepID=UPI0004C8C0C2|nr:hypothetical protein [Streptomyces albus]
MERTQALEEVILNDTLSGLPKRDRIFEILSGAEDKGASLAADFIMRTDDEATTDYLAQYLELIPDAQSDKVRAAEKLRGDETLVRSAARLVPWLPDELLDGFVADYLTAADPNSPLADVLFTIAIHAPGRLRPVADKIDDRDMHRGMLSGAPDELVDAFREKWRREQDSSLLEALALIRTDYAADQIESLRDEIEDHPDWELLLELAGKLPDSEERAGYRPAYMGFLGEKNESPHTLGGAFAGDVPLCHECEAPAVRILTLEAKSLPFTLEHNASFFWYSCECGAMDSTTVRVGAGETVVYYGPSGPADPELSLVPGGERSLLLEEHRNQVGVSMEAVPGASWYQVGGLPQWVDTDRHPRCPECGSVMPFLAAIAGGSTRFGEFGYEGVLYGFWCDRCRVSSTKYQD